MDAVIGQRAGSAGCGVAFSMTKPAWAPGRVRRACVPSSAAGASLCLPALRLASPQPGSPARNGRLARPCDRSAISRLASGRSPARLASFSRVPLGYGGEASRAWHFWRCSSRRTFVLAGRRRPLYRSTVRTLPAPASARDAALLCRRLRRLRAQRRPRGADRRTASFRLSSLVRRHPARSSPRLRNHSPPRIRDVARPPRPCGKGEGALATSAVPEAVAVQAASRTRRASFLFTVQGRGAARRARGRRNSAP